MNLDSMKPASGPTLDVATRVGPPLTLRPVAAGSTRQPSAVGDVIAVIVTALVTFALILMITAGPSMNRVFDDLPDIFAGHDDGPAVPARVDAPAESAPEAPTSATAPAPAGATSVVLVNRGNRPIIEVHVSSAADKDWGPDVLGNSVVAEGGSVTLTPDGSHGCRFDLLAVFDGGATEERRNLDFCALDKIELP
jgi:hypothetical protein